jgi:hypothetical protein
MIDVVVVYYLFPIIIISIHQLEPSAGILYAYATSAAVAVAFGIVGVVANEHQVLCLLGELYGYMGWLAVAHSMFESIFYY